jgi:hypothetical protein
MGVSLCMRACIMKQKGYPTLGPNYSNIVTINVGCE